jgi:hypothetical protein
MTVKQLIEHLQTLDPELRVFSRGYEGGLDDVNGTSSIIDVELNVNSEWYYGKHEETHKPTETAVKGVIL